MTHDECSTWNMAHVAKNGTSCKKMPKDNLQWAGWFLKGNSENDSNSQYF